MDSHGIGLDTFSPHRKNGALQRLIAAAQRTHHGALCLRALGVPLETLRVDFWAGVPDGGDRATFDPPDHLAEDAIHVANAVSGVMWCTGTTFFHVDADGWAIALFEHPDAWAHPPRRILPALGMVVAPNPPDSGHGRLAQLHRLNRISPRLERFRSTVTRWLGAPLPPLRIDTTICTI